MRIDYHPRYDCFIYRDLDDPMEIAACCPQARELPCGAVVIPNDHELLQKISLRGVPVGMPMVDYDWPAHGFRPTFAQRAMSNFAVLNPKSFNLSEMRTGKTLGALWAADYIMQKAERKGERVRALIVCQLSTVQRTWADAINEHLIGRRSCVALTGSAERRSRRLDGDSDFYIINYEGLRIGASTRKAKVALGGLSEQIAGRGDIQIVVFDEASAFRDPRSIRSKVSRLMFADRKYLWLLTGTPTPTAPTDAYGPAKLVNNALGESFTGFKNRTMMQLSKFKWKPRKEAAHYVSQVLQPAVRYTQADCFDAPQSVTMKRDCELSPEQNKRWREMKRELTLTMANGEDVSAVNEAALRSKLIQIACGAVYDDDHKPHFLDCASRLGVMMEIIEEAPKKIIVFAPLTSVLSLISVCLVRHDIDHVLVDGSVTGHERDERLRSFMVEGGPRVLVAHPGPVARGLDLTSAATVVWFGPTDNTEDYIQANERINGPKQTHKMTIVEIAATALEREIYTRLREHRSLQGSILKLLEE